MEDALLSVTTTRRYPYAAILRTTVDNKTDMMGNLSVKLLQTVWKARNDQAAYRHARIDRS